MSMIIYYVSKTVFSVCRFLKEIYATFNTFLFYKHKADVIQLRTTSACMLVIDYFRVHTLSRSPGSIIHLTHPQHLVALSCSVQPSSFEIACTSSWYIFCPCHRRVAGHNNSFKLPWVRNFFCALLFNSHKRKRLKTTISQTEYRGIHIVPRGFFIYVFVIPRWSALFDSITNNLCAAFRFYSFGYIVSRSSHCSSEALHLPQFKVICIHS